MVAVLRLYIHAGRSRQPSSSAAAVPTSHCLSDAEYAVVEFEAAAASAKQWHGTS